jgi:hypothetical protein
MRDFAIALWLLVGLPLFGCGHGQSPSVAEPSSIGATQPSARLLREEDTAEPEAEQEAIAASSHPPVQFTDACTCVNNHGVWRWTAKTEQDQPPLNIPQQNELTPSQMAAWNGPGGQFTIDTPRAGKEVQWYRMTGRVTKIRAEADGDIHIQLMDADGNSDVQVVVEVPLGAPWCNIRKQVVSWTGAHFPFSTKSGVALSLKKRPVIQVTGRAFYDAEHAPGHDSTSNLRSDEPGQVAVWEIHPIMMLTVQADGQ